jgi:cytochrome c oxidase cbb3-type subunit 3
MLRACLASALAMAASPVAAQQQDGKPAMERTVAEAPLSPAPDAIESHAARLGLRPASEGAPVDLGTEVRPNALVHVPVTHVYPGAIKPKIEIAVPDLDDEQRIWRGKQYYNQFNCVGCHAPHGAGGMGPSLSNKTFLYGKEPENIYLTILQGRPMGMPAWGAMLPDEIIWDIVAYVRRMAKDDAPWGKTVSLDAFTTEQVPSGYVNTIDPWAHTEPFSFGQPPFKKVDAPKKQEPEDAAARE